MGRSASRAEQWQVRRTRPGNRDDSDKQAKPRRDAAQTRGAEAVRQCSEPVWLAQHGQECDPLQASTYRHGTGRGDNEQPGTSGHAPRPVPAAVLLAEWFRGCARRRSSSHETFLRADTGRTRQDSMWEAAQWQLSQRAKASPEADPRLPWLSLSESRPESRQQKKCCLDRRSGSRRATRQYFSPARPRRSFLARTFRRNLSFRPQISAAVASYPIRNCRD